MPIKRNFERIIATIFFMLAVSVGNAQTTIPDTNTVVINRSTAAKGVQISGSITDGATHKPLAGIRVQVPEFSAAITDSLGHFTLRVPSYTSTVIVEGEGYDARRIPLKGRQTITAALLDEAHESFNETVNMPFGPKSKTEVTASVGQYNVNSAWAQPNELPDAILQGRIAGLNALRRSGSPGVGANLFLRGYNSLYATNKPLMVIDNMLYDANA